MSDIPKQWEGQVVEGIFPLRKYLGGSDHSAVFLTDYVEGQGERATIKFVPAERATADLVLTNWRFAAQLTHPNLLRIFRAGRCRIDGNDLLYVVMECADEDLADILPERALSPEETRDMLNPVLDALEYLHGKGLVHGDLKPANVFAVGDQLKLSSDMISRAGENQAAPKKASVYDPPEAIGGMRTSAGDVWALGTTLIEVLTQKVPDWQPGPHREPLVPEAVPAPFAEIARQCLRVEPNSRISVADVAERLNARAAAATAGATGVPIAAPASAVPVATGALSTPTPMSASAALPIPSMPPLAETQPAAAETKQPPAPRKPLDVPPPRPALRTQTVAPRAGRPHPQPHAAAPPARPKYLLPLVAGAVVFAAALTVPRLFRQHSGTPAPVANASPQSASNSTTPKAAVVAAADIRPEAKAPKNKRNDGSTHSKEQPAQNVAAAPAGGSMKPASDNAVASGAAPSAGSSSSASVAPKTARVASAKGDVLDQVLPDVSDKARATIHGHVRVAVKVHVDPAGAVSSAELDSEGPSAFFADLAVKAARKWVFTAPEVDGKSVGSLWLLRFVFTSTDTKVIPVQTAP